MVVEPLDQVPPVDASLYVVVEPAQIAVTELVIVPAFGSGLTVTFRCVVAVPQLFVTV